MKFYIGDTAWIHTNDHGVTSGCVEQKVGYTYYIRVAGDLYYKLPQHVFETKAGAEIEAKNE